MVKPVEGVQPQLVTASEILPGGTGNWFNSVRRNWKRILAYVTGMVDEELLSRNEYLVTENRILRQQIHGRIRLTDPERISLATAAKRLGRKALDEGAQIVRPKTILGWHRRLVARKFDGSKQRSPTEGGSTNDEIETWYCRWRRRIARGDIGEFWVP